MKIHILFSSFSKQWIEDFREISMMVYECMSKKSKLHRLEQE